MFRSKKTSKEKRPNFSEKAAVQSLEYLLAAGYVSKKRLYKENFIRGIFFSLGSVLGATVVLALILWIISFANDVPVIGKVVKNIEHSINQAKNK